MFAIHPLLILAIGIFTVLTLIVVFRANAFLAMITAAIIVSFLAPGEFSEKISRVALAFGATAGKIGIIIAMAVIIGRCLIESGAADRIVQMFIKIFGEKRCPISLMSSGFILSIPVFFDTVFYLLLPLARSMHRRTNKRYLLLILAMGVGASITHSLVPPTPGPMIIAETLGIDLGVMMMVGLLVALCTAIVMFFFIRWYSRLFDIPMRELDGRPQESTSIQDRPLPGFVVSILPIAFPVLMISTHTIISTLSQESPPDSFGKMAVGFTSVIGNANLAMFVSAIIALAVFWRHRKPSRQKMTKMIDQSLMSGGMIILITSAGGAFGAMLKAAQIGPAIQNMVVADPTQTLKGIELLLMGFFIAFLIKFAQGSSTVSMITTSAMLAGLIDSPGSVGYHPVYLACAIGFGAQCGNWMNDSGFWIFAKMSGLSETETLKTWTVTVSTLAFVGLFFTILFARVFPLI